jgi:hypothetical protein
MGSQPVPGHQLSSGVVWRVPGCVCGQHNRLEIDIKRRNKIMSYVEETKEHINRVAKLMLDACGELRIRAGMHDRSKFLPEERTIYERVVPEIQQATQQYGYGSPEYKNAVAKLGTALEHHYQNNRHHPEHFPDGINNMTLIDLLEMLCDWIAACEQRGGDIQKSLEINQERYGIDSQLMSILRNTVPAQGSQGNE